MNVKENKTCAKWMAAQGEVAAEGVWAQGPDSLLFGGADIGKLQMEKGKGGKRERVVTAVKV